MVLYLSLYEQSCELVKIAEFWDTFDIISVTYKGWASWTVVGVGWWVIMYVATARQLSCVLSS